VVPGRRPYRAIRAATATATPMWSGPSRGPHRAPHAATTTHHGHCDAADARVPGHWPYRAIRAATATATPMGHAGPPRAVLRDPRRDRHGDTAEALWVAQSPCA